MKHHAPLVAAILGMLVTVNAQAQGVNAQAQDVRHSVVRIQAMQRFPNLLQPWQRQPPREVAGSGVVIEGQRILTNAHLVIYAGQTGQIEVQPYQTGNTFPARIVALSPAMDLAILKLDKLAKKDEEAFFKKRKPIKLAGKRPQIKDSVNIHGYPTGGFAQSVTTGTVSRIEYAAFNYGTAGWRMEVSAGLNEGSSGGPALVQDRMVGLVFAVSLQGQNQGYLIPAEEIQMFLVDIRDDRYDGKPRMWDVMHRLENSALRAKLKLSRTTTGIRVGKPSPAAKPPVLQKGDIITKIGDYEIDNTGMVTVKPNLRLPYTYLVPKLARNNRVPLTLIRNGRTKSVQSPVFVGDELSLLRSLKGAYPSYFVWGPLVFSTATSELVGTVAQFSDLGLRNSPLVTRAYDVAAFKGEQLVVVTSMFPHKTSKGYGNPFGQVVSRVNGTPVRNLRHLAETLRDAKAKHLEFEFADRGVPTLVFDRQEVLNAMEGILADNSIRKRYSDNLSDVWQVKKPKE